MATEQDGTGRDNPANRVPTNIADEMRQSYMDYAMSVIIGRALPDVRDGLKPANRRVLYGMHQMGLQPGRPYRKCAKIVGEVMGNFHPHGDQAIYDTLVRMAQPFNMRAPARRRAGQLRLRRRRPAGGPALHRGAAHPPRRLHDGGHREGDRRLRADLRRQLGRADGPSHGPAEPPRERRRRHRGRHGDEHPAPQPRRGRGRDHLPPRQPGPDTRREARGRHRPHPRPRLPDRRLHHGPPGHPAGLPHRPRLDRDARALRDRGAQGRPRVDRHHRDPVPGQQVAAHREDRRARARRADPRDPGRARRVRPPRNADRRRREEGRAGPGRPQQPLQAHAAAGHVRRHLPRDRRPAPAGADAPRRVRAVHRLPPRRGAPADGVRAAQGRGPRPRARGLRHRPRQPRRGHRAHPRRGEPGGGPRRPRRALRPQRHPGRRDPQAAAAAAHRPRAAEDRRRAGRAARCGSPTCGTSSPRPAASTRSSRRSSRSCARPTRTRAGPRSWPPPTRSRSRTSSPTRTSRSRSPTPATSSARRSRATARSGGAAAARWG